MARHPILYTVLHLQYPFTQKRRVLLGKHIKSKKLDRRVSACSSPKIRLRPSNTFSSDVRNSCVDLGHRSVSMSFIQFDLLR